MVYCEQLSAGFIIISVNTVSGNCQIIIYIINYYSKEKYKETMKLFTLNKEDANGRFACQEGVKYFKGHAMKHFSEEEAYMASIDYRGFETHRRLHDDFRRKTLPALEEELKQSDYSREAVSHFLGVCAGWLIGHTLTEDRAITGKADSKWTGLLPDEQQIAMKQMIVRLISDMFQLNARVIREI